MALYKFILGYIFNNTRAKISAKTGAGVKAWKANIRMGVLLPLVGASKIFLTS